LRRYALGHTGTQQRDQVAALFDRVFERIKAPDQERVDSISWIGRFYWLILPDRAILTIGLIAHIWYVT